MLEAEFEQAIVGDHALPGRRFAVYRNNIAAALVGALGVRYPVTERLTGPEFFAAMATGYAQKHQPRSPVFSEYGGNFPDFVEGFAPAASVPYLADVARLESAWWSAYHAEDRTPLAPDAFEAVPAQDLARTRFTFLPSVSVLRSRWPVVAIWTANRGDGNLSHIDLSCGENALVARPRLDVTIQAIASATAGFVDRLMAGLTLGEAAERSLAGDPEFDITAALGLLIAAQCVCAIDKDGPT